MENATLLMYIRYLVGDGYNKLERLLSLLDPRVFKTPDVHNYSGGNTVTIIVRNGETIGGVGGSSGLTPTQTLSLDVSSTSLEIGTMALLVASLLKLFAQGNINSHNNNNNVNISLRSSGSVLTDLTTENQVTVEAMQYAKENVPLLKECLMDLLPSLFFGKNQNKELETLMGRLYHYLRNFDSKRIPSSTGSYIGGSSLSSHQDSSSSSSFNSPDNSPRSWSPKAAPRSGPLMWH